MAVKPIAPGSDSRVTHETAVLNGHTYHYLLGLPKNKPIKATVFLIHGWPDIAFGWRYQIPALIEMGFRVVAMDMMGYGGTDAPRVPPESINLYTFKRASDDIAELARQLQAPTIVLGGHDWGGAVVYRAALWYPKLISHVFAVCTPYWLPSKTYMTTEELVKGPIPQFAYQLNLADLGPNGPEANIKSKDEIRQFVKFVSGGKGPNGEHGFTPMEGMKLENLGKLEKGPLMSEEELEYYTEQFSRTGLHGPMNWYRTRRANYEDELNLSETSLQMPVLFIQAERDFVLKPEMSKGMEKHIPQLSRGEVDANHFCLWEKPEEVNRILKEWVEGVVFGGKSVL
ncbi:alpha/beta-hydrolase [Saccharata proteae CBS 121410]|uniref:Alpha/beta-hydrolase n=1 Tax=Saccharata proteae CBS 121410 TaxID=1314787 RepID=A0A9P4HTZ3_9PEZI|nr:alpha/beta-hydrolase [Saccharata proteae CBS 121410]